MLLSQLLRYSDINTYYPSNHSSSYLRRERETSHRNLWSPGGNWGNLQWVKYLLDMLTEANMQASDYYVNQLLRSDQYKRIQLYFDLPEAPKLIRGKTLGLDVKRKDLLDEWLNMLILYLTDERRRFSISWKFRL